jgi:hypothetical protein
MHTDIWRHRMHVATLRRRALLAGTGLLALVAAVLPPAAAHAAPASFTPTATYNGGGNRYTGATVTSPEGVYRVATNLWNPAVSGGFTMNYDTAQSGFSVTNYTANSYFGSDTNTGPACTNGADSFDPNCDWAGAGDPWINPNSGVRDQYATTGGTAPFVAQQPPADGVNHTTGTANEFSGR